MQDIDPEEDNRSALQKARDCFEGGLAFLRNLPKDLELPGDDAVALAAARGDLPKLLSLLNSHPDAGNPPCKALANLCPLSLAAAMGHLDCLRALESHVRGLGGELSYEDLNMQAQHWAAAAGRAECAVFLAQSPLVAKNASFNSEGSFSPLMAAVIMGQTETAKALIPLSDLGYKNSKGRTALLLAARCGRADCVEALLPGSDPLAVDWVGFSALSLAAEAGSLDCLRLLAPVSDARQAAQKSNPTGRTALMNAVKNAECVRFLLPLSDPLADAEGWSALFFAAQCGNLESVRLLASHCDPKKTDEEGQTPLMIAAHEGCADIVRLLLPLSDPRAVSSNGVDALMAALAEGRAECAWLLLGASDFFVNIEGERDWTPLMSAASAGLTDLAAEFLRMGDALPEAERGDGEHERQALMLAAERGHAECVALLAPRCGGRFANKDGRTPLMAAAAKPSVECVRLLLGVSDARAVDEDRHNALMLAAEAGCADCVRLLLPHCDAKASVKNGATALIVAAEHGHAECVRALLPFSDPLAAFGPKGDHGDALTVAARSGSLGAVQALLPVSNPRAVYGRGISALMEAAACGNLDCALALAPVSNLAARSDLGLSPLMFAAQNDHAEVVRALLPMFDPLEQISSGKGYLDGSSALIIAAGNARDNALAVLLPVSDPAARDARGRTALLAAAEMSRSFEGIRCLLALLPVSDPLAQDREGLTALMHAARMSPVAFDELLPVSNPKARSREGLTALMQAIQCVAPHGAIDLIELSDVAAWTKNGESALTFALEQDDEWTLNRIDLILGAQWPSVEERERHVQAAILQAQALGMQKALAHLEALSLRETLAQEAPKEEAAAPVAKGALRI